MIIYYVNDGLLDDGPSVFCATLSGAHKDAKSLFSNAVTRGRARVDMYDVPTDKASLMDLMSQGARSFVAELPLLRSWGLTNRGGLKPLEAGE